MSANSEEQNLSPNCVKCEARKFVLCTSVLEACFPQETPKDTLLCWIPVMCGCRVSFTL